MFAKFCNKYLIVEFIPVSDKKVIFLTRSRKEIIKSYDLDVLLKKLENYFELIERKTINSTNRILYFWKKKNNDDCK
jgi:hypothetical protein